MGETSTLACLIGAAILIATGVGSWRIMAGVLAGGMGLSSAAVVDRQRDESDVRDAAVVASGASAVMLLAWFTWPPIRSPRR